MIDEKINESRDTSERSNGSCPNLPILLNNMSHAGQRDFQDFTSDDIGIYDIGTARA